MAENNFKDNYAVIQKQLDKRTIKRWGISWCTILTIPLGALLSGPPGVIVGGVIAITCVTIAFILNTRDINRTFAWIFADIDRRYSDSSLLKVNEEKQQ
jgi:hypothetical protein